MTKLFGLLSICLLRVTCGHTRLGNEILRNSGYEVSHFSPPILGRESQRPSPTGYSELSFTLHDFLSVCKQIQELQGRRVAILSNPTGVIQDTLDHIVDDSVASGVNVACILSPEHGFRGDHQAETGDPLFYIDEQTGLPVLSAYKMQPSEMASALSKLGVDCILVDLQDVGVRLYTFVWTMYAVMEAAQLFGSGFRFVIADRPNPLGGVLVDGPLLNVSCCASGYGRVAITHVHGLTIGELGLFFNASLAATLEPGAGMPELVVVKAEGWRRHQQWEDTGLAWVPPSPNLPTPLSSLAYGATVFIEATTVAEGRGTTTPFTLFGAPFLGAPALAVALNNGTSTNETDHRASFRAAYFNPTFSKYNGTDCAGVQWVRDVAPLFSLAALVLVTLRDISPPGAFQWNGSWFGHPGTELIDEYAGTPAFREMIDNGSTALEIASAFIDDVKAFRETRAAFLLYD